MLASDLMVPAARIITIRPDENVRFATTVMLRYEISSILVAVADRYFGFITKIDLLQSHHYGKNPDNTYVRDVMIRGGGLVFVKESDTIDVVAEGMVSNGIHHVLVKNNVDKVTGLLSTLDLVKVLSTNFPLPVSIPKLLSGSLGKK